MKTEIRIGAYLTNSADETKQLGKKLARGILKEKTKKKEALAVGLTGELGAGKTAFLQGFARGLRIKGRVLSPTFVIYKKSKIPASGNYKNFFHIDCYRLKNEKEILDLGFRKIIGDPENIVVVEWAERVRKIMPRKTIWIKFKFLGLNSRKIILKNGFRKKTFCDH